MLLLKATTKSPFRAFALFALLAVFGTQLLEASHTHGIQDSPAHCLLCKSSADTALPASAPVVTAFSAADTAVSARTSATRAVPTYRHPPRGPPLHT
tara:strand:- start:1150 stop:1440 length:291 start_codon:yes stop_codon:yes gene_type:complete